MNLNQHLNLIKLNADVGDNWSQSPFWQNKRQPVRAKMLRPPTSTSQH